MNTNLDPKEALALIPEWNIDSTVIEQLDGGFNNRTYRIRSDGRDCVLRLTETPAIGVSRKRSVEVSILKNAARVELAPQLVFSDEETGILVTEYLDGAVWRDRDINRTDNIEALAVLLRHVHAMPASGHPFDLLRAARYYRRQLHSAGVMHALSERCVDIVRDTPASDKIVCCHNDVVAANIIEAGGLRLIDWEYACDNDRMFDLASVIGYHDFNDQKTRTFLSAYVGNSDQEQRESLDLQVRAFNAIQWLWLACRHIAAADSTLSARLDFLQERIRYF